MSIKTNKEEVGKYLANISLINRKILRYIFDLELKKTKICKNIQKI